MLERISALASAKPYRSSVLIIAERGGFSLTQVAGLDGGFEGKLSAIVGALPQKVSQAQLDGDRVIFRVGPAQFWIVGPEADDVAGQLQGQCAVTPLTSSRVRIAIAGAPAREVMAMLTPVDFYPTVFTPGSVALTGIHHTPVTIHCTGADAFDLYVMRTFARDVWDAITDAGLCFADHA